MLTQKITAVITGLDLTIIKSTATQIVTWITVVTVITITT